MADFGNRIPDPGIDARFWQRWSPRAFDGQPIDDTVIARLIDAARWTPSCFNEQPWRIHTSSEATFDAFLDLLVEGNQGWAKDASLLGFFVTKRLFDRNGAENPYARFDAGAAWMAMSLQAREEGLYTHGMGGIRHDAVAEYLELDTEQFDVVMGFAVGYAADAASLSEEQAAREVPNGRLELDAIWSHHS